MDIVAMPIRGSANVRCEGCRLHADDCMCELLPQIATRTEVVVVVHAHEALRPSNTGHLVVRMLERATGVVYGAKDQPLAIEPSATKQLLLHPDGRALTVADRGARLLVADGSWHQARRMTHRIGPLRDAERVSVPPRPTREVFIRHDPRAEHLCTLEAVARALGVLESADVEERLLSVLRIMVKRSLARRYAARAAR